MAKSRLLNVVGGWSTLLKTVLVMQCVGLAGCGAEADQSPAEDSLSSTQQGILGGKPVPNSQYPSIGHINLPGGICTGTLISGKHVLTAAHCVTNVAPQSIQFALPRDGNGKVYFVKSVRIHPSYTLRWSDPKFTRLWQDWPRPEGIYDLAVLELTTTISDVTPMAFGTDPSIGGSVTMAGYGITPAGTIGKLNAGTNTVLAMDRTFFDFKYDPGTATPYNGDSGGPLMNAGKLVGVVQGGSSSMNLGAKSWFSRVSSVRAWINNVVANNPSDLVADAFESEEAAAPPAGRKSSRPVVNVSLLGHYAEPRSIHNTNDADAFAFRVSNGQKVTFSVDQPGDMFGQPNTELWRNGGVQVALTAVTSPWTNDVVYTANCSPGYTYEFIVRRPSSTKSWYMLTASVDSWVPQADALEPNNTSAQATLYYWGLERHATLSAQDEDWFQINMDGNTLIATHPFDHNPNDQYTGDTVISLYNSNMQKLAENDDRPGGYYSMLELPNMSRGDYYLRVTGYNGQAVPFYSLNVSTF